MLQCAVVCCSVLQCQIAAAARRAPVLQCVAVRCSALQCVAECCSVLPCQIVATARRASVL